MMFLKSLTLRGFKSFADKTTLALEPGISVVVGPNGSGKSNVVDAISWVLGEQGARSLRGGRMEDVIFAGSPSRPALAMAEVTLTIDNSSGALPLEFGEVSISRMLFRSGEAEYRLNGLPCRLLDIREVLADGGIGREQHTIIGQGHLDEMLTADPAQIRAYIEEAAGVAKHRRRRERALRRMAGTEANLVRIGDVATEVRRLLRPLREQAELSRRHAGYVEELERVKVIQSARELTEIRRHLGPVAAEDLEAPIRDAARQLLDLEAALAAGSSRRAEAIAVAERAREVSWAFNRLIDRLASLARLAHERQRTLSAELAGITEAGAQARLDELARELAATLPARQEAGAAVALAESQATGRRQELGQAELALSDVQARLNPLRAAHREAQAAVLRVRGELAATAAAVDASGRERSRAGERRRAIDAARVRAVQLLEEATAALDALEDVEAPQMAALAAVEADVEAALKARQAALAELSQAEREAATWRARAQVRAGASPQAVRSLASSGLEGVIGVLADLVEVPASSKAALEALVGPASSVLVVADALAAQRVLEAAGGGEPLGLLIAQPDGAHPLAGQRLTELVKPLGGPAEAALGGVYVAPGTSEAARLAGQHPEAVFVTLAGVMATGRLLVRTSAAAGARATNAEAALTQARERLATLDRQIAAGRKSYDEAAATLNRADAAIAAVVDRAASAEREIHGLDREAAMLDESDQHTGASVSALTATIAGLREQLAGLESAAQVAGLDLQELAEEQSAAGRLRSGAAAALEEARLELARAHERWRLLVERCAALGRAQQQAQEQAARVGGRRAELSSRMAAAASLSETAQVLGVGAGAWAAEAKQVHQTRAEQTAALDASLADLQAQRNALAARLDGLRQEARAVDLSRAELRLRARILEERIVEGGRDVEGLLVRFGRRLEDEDPGSLEDPWDRTAAAPDEWLQRRQGRLERDLAAMGRVNPLAASEFAALTEREAFLAAQIADLRASKRDLSKVVSSVDERIQELFGAAFGDVSREYEQVFAALFPGGQGRLRLSDPSDPLESGVEVEAKPGGKSLRRLSLLSGGERALAGLALAFAIFRARPSPFYVLDEVEAALDDVNLHRFLGLLQDFRSSSQLIVVTHQKRTMELADVLYGVSVRPDGASRVISQRLASQVGAADAAPTAAAHPPAG